MLFNSVEFIFGFFPVTALVFFGIARRSHPAQPHGSHWPRCPIRARSQRRHEAQETRSLR